MHRVSNRRKARRLPKRKASRSALLDSSSSRWSRLNGELKEALPGKRRRLR
jgi:hypothetical protein